MVEIDPITGLPKELGVWDTIAKESQKIKVYAEKRKFRKLYTIIKGLDEKQIDVKDLLKKLKSKLACGGTLKEGVIELQGEHVKQVKEMLVKLGFSSDSFER